MKTTLHLRDENDVEIRCLVLARDQSADVTLFTRGPAIGKMPTIKRRRGGKETPVTLRPATDAADAGGKGERVLGSVRLSAADLLPDGRFWPVAIELFVPGTGAAEVKAPLLVVPKAHAIASRIIVGLGAVAAAVVWGFLGLKLVGFNASWAYGKAALLFASGPTVAGALAFFTRKRWLPYLGVTHRIERAFGAFVVLGVLTFFVPRQITRVWSAKKQALALPSGDSVELAEGWTTRTDWQTDTLDPGVQRFLVGTDGKGYCHWRTRPDEASTKLGPVCKRPPVDANVPGFELLGIHTLEIGCEETTMSLPLWLLSNNCPDGATKSEKDCTIPLVENCKPTKFLEQPISLASRAGDGDLAKFCVGKVGATTLDVHLDPKVSFTEPIGFCAELADLRLRWKSEGPFRKMTFASNDPVALLVLPAAMVSEKLTLEVVRFFDDPPLGTVTCLTKSQKHFALWHVAFSGSVQSAKLGDSEYTAVPQAVESGELVLCAPSCATCGPKDPLVPSDRLMLVMDKPLRSLTLPESLRGPRILELKVSDVTATLECAQSAGEVREIPLDPAWPVPKECVLQGSPSPAFTSTWKNGGPQATQHPLMCVPGAVDLAKTRLKCGEKTLQWNAAKQWFAFEGPRPCCLKTSTGKCCDHQKSATQCKGTPSHPLGTDCPGICSCTNPQ